MFYDFFFHLRKLGVPATTGEFLDLLKALSGYADGKRLMTPERFYFVSRCCLVRDEKYFDAFDRAFSEMFLGSIRDEDAFRQLLDDWLKEAASRSLATDGPRFDYEELWRKLEERLKEQEKRHDGGKKWVGTGGASPFGNSGENPAGFRIGGGSGGRSAIDSLDERRYREYSDDEKLSVRGFKIALRRLRDLRREGALEFRLSESIEKTSERGGDPEIIFRRSRKNRLTVLLLMDVGGSMSPHTSMVSRLFSAASKMNHFREFRHFYFHNALYDFVFEDARFTKGIPIDSLYKKYDGETRIIFAGDACMNPYELFDKRHAFFEYYYRARGKDESVPEAKILTGYERMKQFFSRYPYSVWLNPEPVSFWMHETISAVSDIFPMFEFTTGGLTKAVRRLLKR